MSAADKLSPSVEEAVRERCEFRGGVIPGAVGLDRKATCPACGKRVGLTKYADYRAHTKPAPLPEQERKPCGVKADRACSHGPEQAPVSPGMGKGEERKDVPAGCPSHNAAGWRCVGDRRHTSSHYYVAPPKVAAIAVPRETLQRVWDAAELVDLSLGDVVLCGFAPSVDPQRWAKQVQAPLRAALAELRGLMEGE